MTRTHALACLVLLLSACSNKAVYDNMQLNNARECDSAPLSEYEACMKRASTSYEEYEHERQQVLREESAPD